jgi:hypothetical protein
MSGPGPTLFLPHGGSAQWNRAVTRADGTAIDLSTVTAIEWLLKRSSTIDEAEALITLDLDAGISVVDAVAGIIQHALTAAQSATPDPYGEFYYFTRLTFADGTVILPDELRGTFINDPVFDVAAAEADGEDVDLLADATGTGATGLSNAVINRYDLTGLTGGTSTDLDGLSEATLASLTDGAILELFFTGSISARFRLRAMVGTEAEATPWLIICDHDTERVFELIGVTKQGAPCVWNSDTEEFHQQIASGTPAVPAMAETGFSLPA